MRMIIVPLALVASLVLFAASAEASGCYLDGHWYPEGTTYGSYVCIDGEWVRR